MGKHSDLEEGEIPDSPSSPVSEKVKDLPRRYNLKRNKNARYKHKRNCKHVVRYHAKKIANKMKTPTRLKNSYRNYKSPHTHDHYRKSTRPLYNNKNCGKSLGLNEHKSFKVQPLVPKNETKIDDDIFIIENSTPNPPIKATVKNEECEDLEELRRIALASCFNRNSNNSQSLEKEQNFTKVEISNTQLNCNNELNIQEKSKVTDNYEVVDMEVDEDVQNPVEIETNDLFVIDTEPSHFQESATIEEDNVKNEESENDYEEEILRAELLCSVLRKRYLNDPVEFTESVCETDKVPNKADVNSASKENIKVGENVECNVSNLEANKVKSPKKFIISLKAESSSDESEDDDTAPDSAIASLEALISDARQKSSLRENTDNESNISKAVSCLSKAQQKEYSLLMKVLAKKNNIPQVPKNEKKIIHSKSNDLKILAEKIKQLKENLKKEKEDMGKLANEVSEKRNRYVKSKMDAQILKEKFIAAEKLRRGNLALWSKSYKHFEVVKKSVLNLEKKLMELQILYSKVGSNI